MIKNTFTVAPMLVKMLGSMAHNGYGFVQGWNCYSSAHNRSPIINKSSLFNLLLGDVRLLDMKMGFAKC